MISLLELHGVVQVQQLQVLALQLALANQIQAKLVHLVLHQE